MNSSSTALNEMVDAIVPIVNGINGYTKVDCRELDGGVQPMLVPLDF